MRQKCYLTLATGRVWLISYKLRLFHMGSDVGQIFQTGSLHRDHSILYALVCEKDFTDSQLTQGSLDYVCVGIREKIFFPGVQSQISLSSVQEFFFIIPMLSVIVPRLSRL